MFFTTCLFPKILGYWYIRFLVTLMSYTSQSSDAIPYSTMEAIVPRHQLEARYYIVIAKIQMVGCDNSDCKIEW